MNFAIIQHFSKEDITLEMMQPHIEYIKKQIDNGKIIVSGPFIDDMKGGMFILDVENEEEMQEIVSKDPAVISGLLKNKIRKYNITFYKK